MSYDKSTLKFNHTCLRIKDPKRSIEFYTKNFGFKLLAQKKNPSAQFDLYFLAYPNGVDSDGEDAVFAREGVLELTHNYGTENDESYHVNNGNEEPHRGFGHICVSVDNIEASCTRLEEQGVKFQKRQSDGRQKDIAFALDPDGYWIELIEHGVGKKESTTSLGSYKFNHTMIRVKDPVKSIKFYKEVLGMKLLSSREHPNAKFTLYFLGYKHDDSFVEDSLSKPEQAPLESVLELTWNWGTEKDADFKYHNGNDAPQGYGHIGLSVDNCEAFCKEIEEKFGDKVTWRLKYGAGKMKNIAFIQDPDSYSIELLSSYPKL